MSFNTKLLNYLFGLFELRFFSHHPQNRCYPRRCLLAHFEATLDFILSEFTCP